MTALNQLLFQNMNNKFDNLLINKMKMNAVNMK